MHTSPTTPTGAPARQDVGRDGFIGVDLISCTVLMDIKLARQGEPKRPLAGSSLVEKGIMRLSGLLPEPHGAKLVAAGIHKVS